MKTIIGEDIRKIQREKYIALQKKRATSREFIIGQYHEKLNKLLFDFYDNLCSSEEDNQALYDMQNNAWKAMCQKANRFKKSLRLPFDAFEKTVFRNHQIIKINELEPTLTGDILELLEDKELTLLLEDEAARTLKVNQLNTNQ
jgi:hypothetical protein